MRIKLHKAHAIKKHFPFFLPVSSCENKRLDFLPKKIKPGYLNQTKIVILHRVDCKNCVTLQCLLINLFTILKGFDGRDYF